MTPPPPPALLLSPQFAQLAKTIQNAPQVNEKLSDRLLLQRYRAEADDLRAQRDRDSKEADALRAEGVCVWGRGRGVRGKGDAPGERRR